jgi:glycosyltransferase involved in cell wall biosynthesis
MDDEFLAIAERTHVIKLCIVGVMTSRDSAFLTDRPKPTIGRSGKVCLLIGQLGLGGAEKQIILLAKGLYERGVDTRVLVMFEGGPREDALHAAGVPVVHLGFRRRVDGWRMLQGNVTAFSRLVRYLHQERPDVLHAFLIHSYVMAAPAALLTQVPAFIAGRRNMGEFANYGPFTLALERAATRATDLLIANAHAVAEVTRVRDRVPHDKITVIYNGLPDAAFDPVPPAVLATERPIVLCVANLWPYKGQRYLLQATAELRRQGLECTLVLIGEGPERTDLERLAARLLLDVRFLGARTDVERFLARADVVVLPSLHEGMSNAVMEAMAAGRPVVATDVGGTGELLRDRGLLVPPADSDALAAALGKVLTDRPLSDRLGKDAREWSFSNLHVDTMIDQHIHTYQQLLREQFSV